MDPLSAPGSTSSGWLRALQSREASAWQRLTQLYGPLVYAWCRQGLPAGDAADVLQEVFKAVVVSVAKFTPHGPGRFRGWLRTIARNKVFDHFRDQQGHPEAERDAGQAIVYLKKDAEIVVIICILNDRAKKGRTGSAYSGPQPLHGRMNIGGWSFRQHENGGLKRAEGEGRGEKRIVDEERSGK